METSGDDSSKPVIGGKTLSYWNERWRFVEDGFRRPQRSLRHSVGLFAAKMGDRFMYIGAAANRNSGGLSSGLARAYHSNPSGDKGQWKGKVKVSDEQVRAYVIELPRTSENIALVADLRKAMVEAHSPAWNGSKATIRAHREASYAQKK